MNVKSLLLSAILLWGLQSCQDKPKVTEHYEDGSYIHFEINPEDSTRHGQFSMYDAKGTLMEKSLYANDMLEGQRILYDSTGREIIQEHYKSGQFDGDYTSFYPNGKIDLKGQYIGNVMSGMWNRYYDTGQLMESVTFESNEENGPFIEYHPNGKLKAEGQYLNGDHEHGELKLYNNDGILERTMDCVAGRCSTTWKLNDDVL